MRLIGGLWVCILGASDTFIIIVVFAVLPCFRVRRLGGSIGLPYAGGLRVYACFWTWFNCIVDICLQCGGLYGWISIGCLACSCFLGGVLRSRGCECGSFALFDLAILGSGSLFPLLGWDLCALINFDHVDLLWWHLGALIPVRHVSTYPLGGCLIAHWLFHCGYWCVPSGRMLCVLILWQGALQYKLQWKTG